MGGSLRAMEKNYYELARQIITLVGGEDNIETFYSCVTRLRFTLLDYNQAIKNQDKIEELQGVMSVVVANGKFQIVIGRDVALAFEAILLEYPNLRKKTV